MPIFVMNVEQLCRGTFVYLEMQRCNLLRSTFRQSATIAKSLRDSSGLAVGGRFLNSFRFLRTRPYSTHGTKYFSLSPSAKVWTRFHHCIDVLIVCQAMIKCSLVLLLPDKKFQVPRLFKQQLVTCIT